MADSRDPCGFVGKDRSKPGLEEKLLKQLETGTHEMRCENEPYKGTNRNVRLGLQVPVEPRNVQEECRGPGRC